MEFPVIIPETIDLANLPEDTALYQLIANCYVDHELMLSECSDGALVMECFDCPFHRILDEREEENLRTQKLPLFPLDVS